MTMQQYILRRLFLMIPLLIGISLIAFVISHSVPGDPVAAHLSQKAMEDPVIVATFRAQWGLDKPLWQQYVIYIANLVRGDMGTSIRTHRAVVDDLRQFLPASAELALGATLYGIIVGIPFGVISAIKQDKLIDHVVRVISLIGVSAPVFWLALMGLYVFYFRLGVLPGPGRLPAGMVLDISESITGFYTIDSLLRGDLETFWLALRHLFLPTLVLGSATLGIVTRMTRSSMLEVLTQDYVRTARSKGLTERMIITRHVLKNGLIPTVTVIGLSFGGILAGTVLIETIFTWPGIGRYAYQSCITLDFPAIMGVTILIAVMFSVINLLVDISYAFLDPRLRVGGG
jgi:peptide/nickel transport system permease protein